MKSSHWMVTLFLFSISMANASDFVQLRTFPTHSRIILKVDDSVSSNLKNLKTGFELKLAGVKKDDLVSTPGDEEKLTTSFQKLSDRRLKNIEIKDTEEGVRILGNWKFPGGPLTLARPVMELFEYRDKVPPRYIMDFWLKESPTLREVEAKQKKDIALAEKKKVFEFTQKKQARRLASFKQEEAYLSSMRVCEIPMSVENDIFLKLNIVHPKVDFSRWISSTTPDAGFSYYRSMKDSRDAQYVRLALDLYKSGKWGLVVRTLDFLDKEYPRSEFNTEMKFLRSNAYYRLGLEWQATEILKKLIGDYDSNDKDDKKSAVPLYAAMYLAGKFLQSHLTLAAMENFLWLIQNYPDYGNVWVFHLGVAESLFELKQTERAANEYRWIMENGHTDKIKAEAAFRIGDLYLERQEYAQAVAVYSEAYRDFKKEVVAFPSFFLNKGEALYQLGQFEDARKAFYEAVAHFADYPEGWRATLRLGELVANNTLDPVKVQESRDWFYTTINRYPLSPGATLGRIRLLPCGDHGGMDQFGSQQFFKNVAIKFDGGGKVVMTNFNDFRALARIRTLVTLGPEEEIGEASFQELQTVKSPLARKKIILVATESIQRKIMKLVSEGKPYEALSFFTTMSTLIEKDVESERVDYLLTLSQSASNLGFGTFAQKLFNLYQDKVLRLKTRPNRGPQAKPSESSDDLESEIKHAEEEFSGAKALWISDSKKPEALTLVKEKLQLVKEESKFFYEKEIILGLLEEKQENPKAALAHAARAHLQKPSARVTQWFANLTLQAGDLKDALVLFGIVEQQLLKSENYQEPNEPIERILGVPPVPKLATLLAIEGSLLEKLEKWEEASAKYSQAIDIGLGGNQMIFQYARSLLATGESVHKKKAIGVLEKLSVGEAINEREAFWKRMAQVKLAGENSK